MPPPTQPTPHLAPHHHTPKHRLPPSAHPHLILYSMCLDFFSDCMAFCCPGCSRSDPPPERSRHGQRHEPSHYPPQQRHRHQSRRRAPAPAVETELRDMPPPVPQHRPQHPQRQRSNRQKRSRTQQEPARQQRSRRHQQPAPNGPPDRMPIPAEEEFMLPEPVLPVPPNFAPNPRKQPWYRMQPTPPGRDRAPLTGPVPYPGKKRREEVGGAPYGLHPPRLSPPSWKPFVWRRSRPPSPAPEVVFLK
ncbi:hypothetical protein EDC01DRAFT_632869 [Geopyxis carbonaria]|nr:hypothetical protein EDC01DRAFT_632869 [Geopyxis carbonaria]